MMLDSITRKIAETPPEPAFDRVTKLVSHLLDVPVSLFSVADRDRLIFKSNRGLTGPYAETGSAPLGDTVCQYVVETGKPLPVENAGSHDLLYDKKIVVDLDMKGYLGYPICSAGGIPFGSLCAVASGTRRWTDGDIEMISTLAMAVEAEVGLRTAIESREAVLRELRGAHAALDNARNIEQALDERTRFFTSLSHEVRTPLNHLLGGVALLQIAETNSDRDQYSRMIQDASLTLTRFVDDLVGYARDHTGRDTANVSTFDPRGPVELAMRSIAGGAAEKGLQLHSVLAPNLPATWTSDPLRIERLLINLAGNAIKFTSRGSITLGISMENGRLIYRVTDTGPGIGRQYQDSVFEPFERGDPTVSLKTNGSGLGLSIARSSAKLAGIALTIENSVVGEGTTFALSVPPLN